MWLYYICLLVIIILIIIYGYIKVRFRFWSIQPVFHFYDFYWYIFPCGIISQELPEKNKYCNFKNINVRKIEDVKDFQMSRIIRFIQNNYLQNKENKYLPNKENFIPYFTSHNSSCFISIYSKQELKEGKNDERIMNNKIISIMTTRPLHVFINNGDKNALFDVYYVDYLCVDKNHRKKGIAPEIIQTHEYTQRLLNKNIKISLFKREDELTGIVPLCVYKTYGFEMRDWKNPPILPIEISLIEIGKENLYHLTDFIKSVYSLKKFDILIMMEISNLQELIKTKNIYCYIIIEDGEVICAYFFKKSCTFIRNNIEALVCFASINCSDNLNIFIKGYKVALFEIYKKHKEYQFAVIENISSNNELILNIMKKTKPSIISPTAFFFYNFAYSVFKPERTLIIY